MSVSVDGFIADRDGAFEWGDPGNELRMFRYPLRARPRGVGLTRRAYVRTAACGVAVHPPQPIVTRRPVSSQGLAMEAGM